MLQKFDDRNRNLIVNINGELVHRDEAGISPFDSAVQGGDAVWEGLRLYDGRIFKLKEHLDRLRSSALALAFAQIPTHEAITEEIRRTLAANQMPDGVHIRLTLTRAAVLDLCRAHAIPHQEKDLSLTEVYRADELFCSGTMGELAPVVQVDGRPIAEGRIGPMTRRLTALFCELTVREGEVVLDAG